jgi:hypothetical protein
MNEERRQQPKDQERIVIGSGEARSLPHALAKLCSGWHGRRTKLALKAC